jgi:hypothetical protein
MIPGQPEDVGDLFAGHGVSTKFKVNIEYTSKLQHRMWLSQPATIATDELRMDGVHHIVCNGSIRRSYGVLQFSFAYLSGIEHTVESEKIVRLVNLGSRWWKLGGTVQLSRIHTRKFGAGVSVA